MQLTFKHCNNIDFGEVEIKERALNIKHAINGTGKSSIAKAIAAAISDSQKGTKDLSRLLPYKHQGSKNIAPLVIGYEPIKNIAVFDENYINTLLFQSDELVKGSFDIFVRGEAYEKGMAEIDQLLIQMKNSLNEDPELSELLKDFDEIVTAFGRDVKGGKIHASSPLNQAFKDGNRVANIPAGLEIYSKYIQHQNNYKWVGWQQDGAAFLDIADDCPFCAGAAKEKHETIRKVSEVYNPRDIQNLNKIVQVFSSLSKYFSESTADKIAGFVSKLEGRTAEEEAFLIDVKDQISRLRTRLLAARSLGFASMKDVGKVIDVLNETKINLDLYVHLQSEATRTKVDKVNDELDKLLSVAGKLQGGVARQRALIELLVKANGDHINNFLKNAGYSYHVILKPDQNGEYRLKLEHNDVEGEISEVKSRLSFGERNAFALVLFMFDALKKNADLVILDDPISSFDKNKKYAIMEMLFTGKEASSFMGKTVLMLTHDFDPVVDIIRHHRRQFGSVTATFLENKSGVLSEIPIEKDDIQTFVDINLSNIDSQISGIHKAIYLRRFVEVNSRRFPAAFAMLSSLIHRRPWPTIREVNGQGELEDRKMTEAEFEASSKEIIDFYPGFNYQALYDQIKDDMQLKALYEASESNYEKLHLYRMIFEEKEDHINSKVITKFINQAFHIENDYIYQLNPRKYQMVPQYVIDECDKHIELIK